uniref:Hydroxysteroid (17-beta) dehydrogenase 3 n=1 Tax=Sphaeramia orbicularis TaxID=375764 RepID=A0A672Z9R3_9TELE
MDLLELFFVSLGAAVVVHYVVKLLLFIRILYPKIWFPLPKSFFTSMGEWAVVTGASEGIGRAYAFALAEQGMNVVIISRTKLTLDQVAKDIADATGKKVKVIVADFIKESVFSEIEEQLKDMNIGVLVNNVGMLPSFIPREFLEAAELDQTILKVINCNVKTMVKMCKIVLPGMEDRGKGVIVNISSGIASVPFPLYTLYAATKVFVERFSQGLQAEYKDKGIIIQVTGLQLFLHFFFKIFYPVSYSYFLSYRQWLHWGLHPNGRLSKNQHDDSVTRRLCKKLPAVS